jgi:pentatricopeptide repeat protein
MTSDGRYKVPVKSLLEIIATRNGLGLTASEIAKWRCVDQMLDGRLAMIRAHGIHGNPSAALRVLDQMPTNRHVGIYEIHPIVEFC